MPMIIFSSSMIPSNGWRFFSATMWMFWFQIAMIDTQTTDYRLQFGPRGAPVKGANLVFL
jgi:hypothetical protein